MARVRFTADYDYKPTPGSTVAYRAGWSGSVRRECAERAIAAGKAVPVPRNVEPDDGQTASN